MGSSSSVSSSVSWDALSDMDSLFSLPRLTILRKEGRLDASASLMALRSPQGRLSLRSSLRRPVKLHRIHSSNDKAHKLGGDFKARTHSIRLHAICIVLYSASGSSYVWNATFTHLLNCAAAEHKLKIVPFSEHSKYTKCHWKTKEVP